MRCDAPRLGFVTDAETVSIPAGFSDALRLYELEERYEHVFVSIPAGFSDALRLSRSSHHRRRHEGVSIPAGFSDALRREVSCCSSVVDRFQSLLGFLMRCDVQTIFKSIGPIIGFNPCWVF